MLEGPPEEQLQESKTAGAQNGGSTGSGAKRKGARKGGASSECSGSSIHKTASRWENRPGSPANSQAVTVSDGHVSYHEDPDWELDTTLEQLLQGGKEILQKIQYTNGLRASLQQINGSDETIQIIKGDRIWILPDKQSAGVPVNCASREDLPDQHWDVGEVVNCLAIHIRRPPSSEEYEHSFFIINKVEKYGLAPNERILSDHLDFVALSSYAGFADDIFTHLQLRGLYMSAEDRLTPVKDRKKRGKKDYVWIHGFDRRKKGLETFYTEEAQIRMVNAIKAQKRTKDGKEEDGKEPEQKEEEGVESERPSSRSRTESKKKKRRKTRR